MASRTQYEIEVLLGARRASSFESNIHSASSGLENIGKTAKRVAGIVATAFAAVNVKDAIGDAMNTYVDYEQSLANTAAIAQATSTEYDQLNRAARDAGKSTTKTAQESAEALGYMALAGWDVNESTQGLMPVLKMSEATQLDLAETSDLVTDSMSALKLEVSDMPQYLDTVVKGNNKANMTSQQMMQSMILSGGAARSLSIGYQDLGTAIGILANNGTKGNKSGTAMNAMLTRIASNSNALGRMKRLKINIFDNKGDFIGLENALRAINEGVSGLSDKAKAAALKDIAGTQYYSKMIYLLESVKEEADGTSGAWDELNAQLYDSTGALDEMDEKVTGTTSGSIQRMQSALDDAKISFGDAFNEEYIGILDGLGEGFNNLSGWIQDFSEDHAIEIHDFFINMEEDAEYLFGLLGDGIGFVVENFDAIESGIAGVGTAIVSYKVVSGIVSMTTALASMSPATLGAAGLFAAVAGINAIRFSIDKAKESAIEASLDSRFGDVSLSLEQIDDVAQQIVGRKNISKISTMLESLGNTRESIDSMSDSLNSINQIEWKLGAGFKLDQDDQDTYVSCVKQYIQDAQNVIDNQGYTVSVATDLLLGKNSDIGLENNEFYSGLNSELNVLQKKLNKKINKAVKNGVSVKKDEAIQKLLGDIGEITNAVTGAQNEAALQALELKYSGKDLDANTFKELSKEISEYENQVTEGAAEAYETSMTNLNARLSLGDISQKDFETEKSELEQGYFKTKADAYMNGYNYLMKSITDTYPEVGDAMEQLESDLDVKLSHAMNSGLTGEQLYDQLNGIAKSAIAELDVSDETSGAIMELFENGLNDIYSSMTGLRTEMTNADMEVPEELASGISSADAMQALSGSVDDMMYLLGDRIGNNETYTAMVATAERAGGNLPEGIAEGIESKTGEVTAAVNSMYSDILHAVDGESLYTGTINITTSTAQSAVKKNSLSEKIPGSASTYTDSKGKQHTIYKNALGGMYNSEILTTVAEDGPESIIPLNKSSRAKSLLKQTAAAMGFSVIPSNSVSRDQMLLDDFNKYTDMSSSGTYRGIAKGLGDSNQTFVYAPQINITGNADQDTLSQALSIGKEEFNNMMNQWKAERKRVEFG